MKKAYLIFVCVLIVVAPLYYYFAERDIPLDEAFLPGTPIVKIGNVPIRVELALTDEERKKGLSRRATLGEQIDGMLFVFPAPDTYGIWMKDMNFPIDIIWISEDRKIVHIEKNVDPNTYPKSFYPPKPVKYIIETNIHFSDTFNLSVGQEVELPEAFLERI